MKKFLIGGLAVALLAGGTAVLTAMAQTGDQAGSISSATPAMVVEINKSGKITLRGTIDSMGSNSLTVKSWGGDWTVNTSGSTQLQPNDIAKFKQGDFVGVQGTVNSGGAWTIDATTVRDWTSGGQPVREVKSAAEGNKKEHRQEFKDLSGKNIQGKASNINVSGNSLTLTAGSNTYTVNLASGAKLFNRTKGAITLSDIKDGDSVRIYGAISGTTITASILRDISL